MGMLKNPRSPSKQKLSPTASIARSKARTALKLGKRHAKDGTVHGGGFRKNYAITARHHLNKARFAS